MRDKAVYKNAVMSSLEKTLEEQGQGAGVGAGTGPGGVGLSQEELMQIPEVKEQVAEMAEKTLGAMAGYAAASARGSDAPAGGRRSGRPGETGRAFFEMGVHGGKRGKESFFTGYRKAEKGSGAVKGHTPMCARAAIFWQIGKMRHRPNNLLFMPRCIPGSDLYVKMAARG